MQISTDLMLDIFFFVLIAVFTAAVVIFIAQTTHKNKPVTITTLLFVPIFSLGLYWVMGHHEARFNSYDQHHNEAFMKKALLDAEEALLLEQPLLRALENNPENAQLWWELGSIYTAAGRLDDAVKTYQDGLKITNEPALKQKLEQIYQELPELAPQK